MVRASQIRQGADERRLVRRILPYFRSWLRMSSIVSRLREPEPSSTNACVAHVRPGRPRESIESHRFNRRNPTFSRRNWNRSGTTWLNRRPSWSRWVTGSTDGPSSGVEISSFPFGRITLRRLKVVSNRRSTGMCINTAQQSTPSTRHRELWQDPAANPRAPATPAPGGVGAPHSAMPRRHPRRKRRSRLR